MSVGAFSAVVKVLGPNHNGNMFYFQIPSTYTFSGGIIELKMMVSGLNHLLGRVKRSDLVQCGRDTPPPRCFGRANTGPKVINHDNITLGRPENTQLGIWRPPGSPLLELRVWISFFEGVEGPP